MHGTLRAGGVNAVVTASQNVFGSPAAVHWLVILRAMEKPQRTSLVRSAMITPFLGFTGTDLATGGDELLDSATQTIPSWGSAFRVNGIAGVMAHIGPRMTGRVLARPDGERLMTDLRHVGEELHAAGSTAGLAGLIEWLTGRMTDATSEADESSRRLDTDSDAVQIVTVHRGEGPGPDHLRAVRVEPFPSANTTTCDCTIQADAGSWTSAAEPPPAGRRMPRRIVPKTQANDSGSCTWPSLGPVANSSPGGCAATTPAHHRCSA